MNAGDIMALVWLLGGLALIVGEVVIPGLVAVFLGAAALIMAGLVYAGVVSSIPMALSIWMATSLGLILGLRSAAKKLLPAEYTRESTSEALAAYGAEVEVIEACDDEGSEGRIRYQGTSWPARCIEGHIEAGERARLLYQDEQGLAWVVERLDPVERAIGAAKPSS